MSNSAIADPRERRRGSTAERIHRCAQRLTDVHGLDRFTMDDLAEAADVSRRTLFNYFPSKLDAILGEWPTLDEDAVARFRAGGPSGDLVADLHALIRPLITDNVGDREMMQCGRRILRVEPRLMVLAHERYQVLCTEVVEHIEAREGTDLAHQAQVAVSILGAIFDAALEVFLADDTEREFSDHFDDCLTTARLLLGTH